MPIVSSAIYIGVVAFLLPKYFLKNRYEVNAPQDRGLAKYQLGEDGRGITFQPAFPTNQHIKQYVLVSDGAEKSVKCMLAKTVDYIEYDIVLFNKNNEVFNVLSIKDIVEGATYTHSVTLPEETSYISLVITRVDEESFESPVKLTVSTGNILSYSLISLFMTVFTAFAVKLGLVNFLGGVFRESIMNNVGDNNLILLLSIGLALAGIAVVTTVLVIRKSLKNNKARNK